MRKTTVKILVAGSSPNENPVFERHLRNCQLNFVTNGMEAVDQIQDQPFDLLIIDNNLKGLTSLELIERVNQVTQNTLAIILILNSGEEKDAILAMQAGLTDYLGRNEVDSPILSLVVMRALEHKKWERLYSNMAERQATSYLKDPLTQTYNKFYFETRLKEELSRSRRYDFPLTMSLFHIDQYAELKKQYGKKITDQILKELGQFVLRDLRTSDSLARIDQDQFVLLLPHTTLTQAKSIWERLLGQLHNRPFTVEGNNFCITLHVGIASLNKEIEEIDSLIHHLDKFVKENQSSQESLILYLPK